MYRVQLFLLQQHGDRWDTRCFETTYRCLLRAELDRALARAGLQDIRWHFPADTGYYQPIVTARKPKA